MRNIKWMMLILLMGIMVIGYGSQCNINGNKNDDDNGSSGTPPAQVTSGNPANGTSNVSTTTQVTWTAVSGATSYDVYFGASSPGSFIGNQAGTTYNPGTLTYNTPYYWRIDSQNSVGKTTGNVWSFTTEAPPQTDYFLQALAAGARNYVPDGGTLSDNYFTLNTFDVPKSVAPGQNVPVSLSYTTYSGGENAVVYKTVLASWQPSTPLATLENGELQGSARTVSKSFSFTAPTTPGTYRIRLAMVWAFEPITNFYGNGPYGDAWSPGVGHTSEVILKVE